MAIKQLTDEQVRTWTLEQKDRWWLENVYRGDMPQLTLRSGLTGFILGGILSATNLYVGAKTGWTLGVGITSVILAFALYKVLSKLGMGRDFTILENNAMQSCATAAGYMTSAMISSLGAYMIITDQEIPTWLMMVWLIAISLLGVLFAFPMKRRFINDEQLPFPEGRACGVVLETLHSDDQKVGMFKAKLLVISALTAGGLKFLQSHGIQHAIQVKLLGLKEVIWSFPEMLDGWIYNLAAIMGFTPHIFGTDLRQLTIRPELDIPMLGAGALMGIRAGASLLVGAIINYAIVAPAVITFSPGDIPSTIGPNGEVLYGFRNITTWALWGGVSMMTVASLTAFFAKPQVILSAFGRLFGGPAKEPKSDVLKHIELPLSVSLIGVPIVGAVIVWLGHTFFGISWLMGIIAIPLVFVFTLIGANSTALTSITPTGALGKLTQLTFGALAPGNIRTNIMTAGITSEAAGNASNLLMDIKPGYMLGAKPRQQAIAHCIGIFSGALASVPLFKYLFLQNGVQNMQSAEFPMPAVSIWKGVAEVLTQGLDKLPETAIWAAAIGAAVGLVLELVRIASKNKFPLTPVGIGLAFVIPFTTCFAMFMGSFVFWVLGRVYRDKESRGWKLWVDNMEPIAAGVIAGGALIGIADALVTVFIN